MFLKGTNIKRLVILSKYQKILFISIILYTVILSLITSMRHYCFQTFAFDFGIFVQILWNSINNNFMFTQPRGIPTSPKSFLGIHVSPFLVFLVPIYAIARTSYILFVIQSLFLAMPAFVIYKISLKVTNKEDIATIFAIIYLIHPAILWSNWYDFHLEAFIPLFLSMMYYYYISRDKINLLTSAILMLTTFESAAIILFFFVIYMFFRDMHLKIKEPFKRKFIQRNELFFLFIIGIFSITYFMLSEKLMSIVWPERNIYEPARIFGRIDYKSFLIKLSYLFILSFPLAFLSFNSILELIPAIPYLFLAMVTDYEPYYTINWQYPAIVIIPFLLSAIFGYTKENSKRTKKKLIITSLLSFILFSPATPLMSQFSIYWTIPNPTSEIHIKHQALSLIEKDATVLAQENIFPHLAERKIIYSVWPTYLEPPEYIVVDVMESFQFYHEPTVEPMREALFKFTNNYNYGIIAMANGLLILKRDYHGPRNILMPLYSSLNIERIRRPFISFQDYFMEVSWFVPDWVNINGDHLLLKKGFIGNAWWGPYITVPPGRYKVEVELSVGEAVSGRIMDILVYYWNANEVYAIKSIFGNQLMFGNKTTISFVFELTKWVPAIEVVGMNYGLTDIYIYSVKFEVIE